MTLRALNVCRAVFALLSFVCALSVSSASTLTELLDQTISQAKQADCSAQKTLDALQRILCNKKIQIGVRSDYRSMSVREGADFVGFEADLAKLVARRLGVEPRLVAVNAGNRIEKLLNGEIDLILAAMSHTVARDKIVTFIKPHYYSSPSSVFGPVRLPVSVLTDLRTQTVCVPLNTFFSTVLAENNIRMMIYHRADRLVDAVRQGNCLFVAHDQTFLRATFESKHTSADLKNIVTEKMSFLDVPMGMGVKNEDKTLGIVMGQIVAELHQSGVLVENARTHDINPAFLEKQHTLWRSSQCAPTAEGLPAQCLDDAANLSDEASAMADSVKRIEAWLTQTLGIEFSMPMLTGQIALKFFLSGLINSIVILAGGIIAVLLFTVLLFTLMRSTNRVCAAGSYGATLLFQNTPIILLFVVAAVLLNRFGSFTPAQTIVMAILVIGISNGANAAVAMRDALFTRPEPANETLKSIFSLTFIQVRNCLINAAKGTPIASFVGTPELLSVMVNITAFTSTRTSTYVFMAVFYLLTIQLVMYLSNKAFEYFLKPADTSQHGKKQS